MLSLLSSGICLSIGYITLKYLNPETVLQVKELIRLVRPDVVMLELCKDRLGLLVDDRLETQVSNRWHVRKVRGGNGDLGFESFKQRHFIITFTLHKLKISEL